MGMYSFFNSEDIKITDREGLYNWLLSLKDDENSVDYMYSDYLVDVIDGKEFSFANWDNIKLISYWYDYQVKFLDKISDFIEGVVYWEFENNDEGANIEFKNGKTIFNIGQMVYNKYEAKDLLREELI